MRDAGAIARELVAELRAGLVADRHVFEGMTARIERCLRQRDLEVSRQCLRLAQQAMNETPRRHQAAIGVIVDRLADLAIDLNQRAEQRG